VQDRNHSSLVLNDDSLGDIRQTLLRFRRKSPTKLCLQSGLFNGSVRKVTNILKLHPCLVHVMHELKETSKEKLLRTAEGLHTSFEGV
jgi:hypothetical protein